MTARREFVVDKPDIQTIGEKTQFEQAETDIPRAHDALETANMSRANVRANIAVCWGKLNSTQISANSFGPPSHDMTFLRIRILVHGLIY